MNNGTQNCSTPEYGRKYINLSLNLSEIRGSHTDSLPQIKNKSKLLKRGKEIKKNHKYKRILANDSSSGSSSEYETLDTFEINGLESDKNIKNFPQDIGQRETTLSDNIEYYFQSTYSPPIFSSPSDINYDNYIALHSDSLENDYVKCEKEFDAIIGSPVFQENFKDRTKFKTYSGPGKDGERRGTTEISFSPKWVKKVSSKYSSPSDIPSWNADRISNSNWSSSSSGSPREEAFVSHEEKHPEVNFTKESVKMDEKMKSSGSKYSHLRDKSGKSKESTSLCQLIDPFKIRDVYEVPVARGKKASAVLKQQELLREDCSGCVDRSLVRKGYSDLADENESGIYPPLKSSGSKYCHLRIKGERFKRINSPTRKIGLSKKTANVCFGGAGKKEGVRIDNEEPLAKDDSENVDSFAFGNRGNRYSHSATRNELENLLKCDSRETSEENMKSDYFANSDSPQAAGFSPDKSKPKILSIKIIKKGKNSIF